MGDPDLPYIVDGLRHGFRIVDNVDVIPQYDRDNYDSAEKDTAKPLLDKLFAKELSLGRISRVVNRPHCVHSIGAVEKKGCVDLRPITDCSSPRNDSINAYMDYPKQRFKTIDHACKFMSPNCWMAGADICQAYRHAPIHPSHRRLQGFRWMFGRLDQSRYMFFQDNFLCFGLSCAPGIFSRISDVIQRHMHSLGFQWSRLLDYVNCNGLPFLLPHRDAE